MGALGVPRFVTTKAVDVLDSLEPTVFADMFKLADKALFEAVDKDKSGTLDKSELAEMLKGLGHEDLGPSAVDTMLEAMDTNKDGVVQLEEFIWFMDRRRLRAQVNLRQEFDGPRED